MFDIIRLVVMLQRLYPFRWSAEELRRIEEERFRKLLRYAVKNSPYYKRRFAGIDIETCKTTDIPVLTKPEMMEHFDELVTDPRIKKADIQKFVSDPSNIGKLYLGRYGVSHTSGSQGQPALIVQDYKARLIPFAARFTRGTLTKRGRLSQVHRIFNPARMAVLTQKPGFYPSASAFAYFPAGLSPVMKILKLSIFDPMPELIAKLEAFRPNFITGYASALEALGREEAEGRLNLRKLGTLEQLTNVAEPLPKEEAKWLKDTFGVHIFDEYAMGECLALSSGCKTEFASHINIDLGKLEVVDEAGRPVPDGKEGAKILVTNLYNFVQPIIRYEIDDRIVMSPTPCSCGSRFPKVQSIIGRSKDMLWIRVGGVVREMPYFLFINTMHHHLDAAEHQVVQTGLNQFVVRVAPCPGKTLVVEDIRTRIHQGLVAEGINSEVNVEVEIVDAIPRGPYGKVARAQNIYGPPPK
jgi:phenylacetate-coenzyme A ligase PaaK-like adenylate-forming protein